MWYLPESQADIILETIQPFCELQISDPAQMHNPLSEMGFLPEYMTGLDH